MEFIKILRKHRYEIILLFLVFLYILYFTAVSFLRFDNFYTGRFDLGNMVQAVWNTTEGRIFETTDEKGTGVISRLASHADFILIFLSPFYYLWSSPKVLLLIQTIVLAFGAIFVYLIGRNIVKNKLLSLSLGAAFLLNPAVQFTNLYDFHGVVLATTFLLGSFYFLLQKRYLLMSMFLVLAGISKENVWLINSFFGAYLFLVERKKQIGISIFLASIFIFIYLLKVAIPNASPVGEHFVMSYFSRYGDSFQEIFIGILLNPIDSISALFGESQLQFVKQLIVPLGLLSLVSAYILFLVPELVLLLLSENSQLHEIYYQYTATLTPFIFISAIYGIKNLIRIQPYLSFKLISVYILSFSILSSYLFGPLPFAKYPNTKMFTDKLDYANKVEEYLKSINKEHSVSSTNNLGSHLSERRYLYNVPNGIGRVDYVTFLIRKPYDESGKIEDLKILTQVKLDKRYKKVYEYQDFIVFKKVSLD